eukprot:ANDGO_07645.mRNA.1 hypothetical protein
MEPQTPSREQLLREWQQRRSMISENSGLLSPPKSAFHGAATGSKPPMMAMRTPLKPSNGGNTSQSGLGALKSPIFASPTKQDFDALRSRIAANLAKQPNSATRLSKPTSRESKSATSSGTTATMVDGAVENADGIDKMETDVRTEIACFRSRISHCVQTATVEDMVSARGMFREMLREAEIKLASTPHELNLVFSNADFWLAWANAEVLAGEYAQAVEVLLKAVDESILVMPRGERKKMVEECRRIMEAMTRDMEDRKRWQEKIESELLSPEQKPPAVVHDIATEMVTEKQGSLEAAEWTDVVTVSQGSEVHVEDEAPAKEKTTESPRQINVQLVRNGETVVIADGILSPMQSRSSVRAPPNTPSVVAAEAAMRSPFRHIKYTPKSLLKNAGPAIAPKIFSPSLMVAKLNLEEEAAAEESATFHPDPALEHAQATMEEEVDSQDQPSDTVAAGFSGNVHDEEIGMQCPGSPTSSIHSSTSTHSFVSRRDVLYTQKTAQQVDTWVVGYEHSEISDSKRQRLGLSSTHIATPVKRSARKARPVIPDADFEVGGMLETDEVLVANRFLNPEALCFGVVKKEDAASCHHDENAAPL